MTHISSLQSSSGSNFTFQSKVGVTVTAVVGVTMVAIGILAIIDVIPGMHNAISGCFITSGCLSLIFTIRCCYNCKSVRPPILAKNPSPNALDSARKYSNSNSSSEIVPSPSWEKQTEIRKLTTDQKAKLKELSLQNKINPDPDSYRLAQECLNKLALLVENKMSKYFKSRILQPSEDLIVEERKEEEVYQEVAHTFLNNLLLLKNFLHIETESMLIKSSPEFIEEAGNRFKLVKRQIRMILLFLISYEPERCNHLKSYSLIGLTSGSQFCQQISNAFYYFEKLNALQREKKDELRGFLFNFSIYRRHALFRLFPEKIHKRSKCNDQKLNTLLSTTWFHGTGAITSLSETDFTLIPTGWLNEIGVTPFFGEAEIGCQPKGINANTLSGTYLDRIDWAQSYATKFLFKIQKETNTIDEFLKPFSEYALRQDISTVVSQARYLPRVGMAIRRLALWDPEQFDQKKSLILKKLMEFDEIFKGIEDRKPKEIFDWHDCYYSGPYESLRESVKRLRNFLNEPLPSPLTEGQKHNIKEGFPAVLGSLTLLSRPASYNSSSGEYVVSNTAKLGEDLQLLCVKKEDLKKAETWLESYGLEEKMQIFSFEELTEAQKVNKQILPYLIDILSVKKMRSIIAPPPAQILER
ncbi:MAG: hypothetical protein R3E91_02770 [Chlamydiales bacterium]